MRRLGKTGLIMLSLVLALAIAGAGFAQWHEDLTISGTANTGEADVEFLCDPTHVYSGLTYTYYDGSWDKAGENDPDWFHGGQGPDYGTNTLGGPVGTAARVDKDIALTTYELIDTDSDGDADQLKVTITNAYPGYVSGVTFRIHNNGSIPIKVNSITDNVPDGVDVCFTDWIYEGDQFEPGDWQKCGMGIVVNYWDENMPGYGETITFTVDIQAVQWNKYPYTP